MINDQQNRFIDEYMVDFNGTLASKRSGYALGSAHRLLTNPEIREEIDRRIAERSASTAITVANIECMLRNIAELDILDIFDENGLMRPLVDIPPHARKAIASISIEQVEVLEGYHPLTDEPIYRTRSLPYPKMWDKKAAIELLGKYKKMFTDKVEVGGAGGGPVSFVINGVTR